TGSVTHIMKSGPRALAAVTHAPVTWASEITVAQMSAADTCRPCAAARAATAAHTCTRRISVICVRLTSPPRPARAARRGLGPTAHHRSVLRGYAVRAVVAGRAILE